MNTKAQRFQAAQKPQISIMSQSDEVLLNIVSYLKPKRVKPRGPYRIWPLSIESQIKDGQRCLTDVRSLSLTCRRFYHVSLSALHCVVAPVACSESNPYRDVAAAIKSTVKRPFISHHVQEVHMPISLDNHPTLPALLFQLPKIHTLDLEIRGVGPVSTFQPDLRKTSMLQVLRLRATRATRNSVHILMCWPRALKEFYYQIQDDEMHGCCEPTIRNFNIEQILNPQRHSLEKFVWSETGITYWYLQDYINLSKMKHLRKVCIDDSFLIETLDHDQNFSCFPDSLEELQIAADYDIDNNSFSLNQFQGSYWLLGPLDERQRYLPLLKRVRILILTHKDGENNDRLDRFNDAYWPVTEETAGLITRYDLPSALQPTSLIEEMLIQSLIRARVSFDVFVDPSTRYVYAGLDEEGFDDGWM